MNSILIVLSLVFLASCGAPRIKNDRHPLSDKQANFESVLTKVGKEYRQGNGVYVFKKDANLEGVNLEIHTVFKGTYQVRAQGCFVDIPGRYINSEVIKIPVSNFLRDTSVAKTCTVTIQVSPTLKNSEYTIFPRYSIIVLSISERDKNRVDARQMRMDSAFAPIEVELESDGKYQVVRKCVYEPKAIKLGPFDHNGLIELDSVALSEGLAKLDANGNPIPIEDFTGHLGNCYFSIQYSDVTGITKYGVSVNVYKKEFDPLLLTKKRKKKYLVVSGPRELYVCKIHNKSKLGRSRCYYRSKKLPKSYVIEGHTNKRSTYILIGK